MKTMTSYERVRNALNHKPTDRVPFDFLAEEVVWKQMENYFHTSNHEDILDLLGVDRRIVGPKYIGPPLQSFADGSHEIIVSGGPRQKDIPTANGLTATSIVYFPWSHVEDAADLEGLWGWSGKQEWWDFSGVTEDIEALEARGEYWISAHGDPSGLQHVEMWAGDEMFLMTLAADEELAVAMIEKHNEIRLWHALKTLEAGKGKIHELNGGGDYGAQNGLLISREMFCRYFKPLYEKFYREIKKNFDVEIFFHSCGSIATIIPDLIDVGVTILDPIQTSAAGMDLRVLKRQYGDKLCFHGAMDVQSFLPFASPDEVRAKVKETTAILGENGGYIMAPSHNLQPDTPLANILALYGL